MPPFGLATHPETGAPALGTLAHALDLDDVHPAMLDHPSAVLVPAILTLGPAVQATGQRVVTACVAGGELATHLGRATAALRYTRGQHMTSTIGVPAAAATAAPCLHLDPTATGRTLVYRDRNTFPVGPPRKSPLPLGGEGGGEGDQDTDGSSDLTPRHTAGGQASPVPSPFEGEGGEETVKGFGKRYASTGAI